MNVTATVRALVATVLLLPALASCGVINAQTDRVYTPADGENARGGTVEALNVLVVSETPGSGRLIGALVNNDPDTDDTLTAVQGVGEDQVLTFRLAGGETTIPADGLLQLADDEAANVVVSGDPELVAPGTFVELTFSFENAEQATLNVPVLAPGENYGDVELPTDEPTGSATTSGAEGTTE